MPIYVGGTAIGQAHLDGSDFSVYQGSTLLLPGFPRIDNLDAWSSGEVTGTEGVAWVEIEGGTGDDWTESTSDVIAGSADAVAANTGTSGTPHVGQAIETSQYSAWLAKASAVDFHLEVGVPSGLGKGISALEALLLDAAGSKVDSAVVLHAGAGVSAAVVTLTPDSSVVKARVRLTQRAGDNTVGRFGKLEIKA